VIPATTAAATEAKETPSDARSQGTGTYGDHGGLLTRTRDRTGCLAVTGHGGRGGTWLGNPAHSRWLELESDALMRFGSASRTPTGFGYLDAHGAVTERPHELWINCRMMHCFALGTLLGRPGCAPLVDHGIRALTSTFSDREFGGWFTAVAANGVQVERKDAYSHAFVLLAAASAVVSGRPGADELFEEARSVSTRHFWQETDGLVVESYDRTFAQSEAYRGVNANMHTVEAYLVTADVTGDDAWLDRAHRIVRRVIDDFARGSGWRIPEHFDANWEPLLDYNRDNPADPFRPYGATVGHSFEWARLALEAAAALHKRGMEPEGWMLEGARALFARAVKDGWAVDGSDGFVYTVDFTGAPVVHERMHWVATEAASAAATLHRVTGEASYEHWYRTWWDFAADHFIEQPGAWIHELGADHGPSERTWSGKPDVYHALQATLIPRLPMTPAIAPAIAGGHLDSCYSPRPSEHAFA
jgi:sulfoquinovose isomerase